MSIKTAKDDLKARLSSHGAKPTPRQALEAVISFYAEVRYEPCDLEADGDMLLFQWGSFWDDDSQFEINITRQFMFSEGDDEEDDDEAMWQLSLYLLFTHTAETEAFDEGNHWCGNPADIEAFRAVIQANAAFAKLADVPCESSKIDFSEV